MLNVGVGVVMRVVDALAGVLGQDVGAHTDCAPAVLASLGCFVGKKNYAERRGRCGDASR
jgi:hypothetical protein